MAKKPQQKPFCPNCGRVGHPKASDLIPIGDATIDKIKHIRFHTEYGLETLEELLRTSQFKTQLGKNFRPFKLFNGMVYYRDNAISTICAAYGYKLKVCRNCSDVALIGEKWLTERGIIGNALRHDGFGIIKALITLYPNELKNTSVMTYLAMNPEPYEITKLISTCFTPTEKTKIINEYADRQSAISNILTIPKLTRAWVETGIDIETIKPETMQYVVECLPLEDQKKLMARIFMNIVRAN